MTIWRNLTVSQIAGLDQSSRGLCGLVVVRLLWLSGRTRAAQAKGASVAHLAAAVHIEDRGGWWLYGRCGSVTENWRLKPEVSWVRLPASASLFYFPLFSPHNI